MKNVENASLNDELLPLMFELGRLMKREMSREGADPLTYLHIETLRYIQEQGAPSMSEVAEYLKIAPPSATALIDAFVKDGILDRSTDAADRRVVRLQVSAKGSKTFDDMMAKRAKAFSRIIAPLSTQDRDELARILTIITRP
jgi:DNA-binding MarR family transcriptional regulator